MKKISSFASEAFLYIKVLARPFPVHHLIVTFFAFSTTALTSYKAFQHQGSIDIFIAVSSIIVFAGGLFSMYKDYYSVSDFCVDISASLLTLQSIGQFYRHQLVLGDAPFVFFGTKSFSKTGEIGNALAFNAICGKKAPLEHCLIYSRKEISMSNSHEALISFHDIKFNLDINHTTKSLPDRHNGKPCLFMSNMNIFKKVDAYSFNLNAYIRRENDYLTKTQNIEEQIRLGLKKFKFISDNEEDFGETYIHTLSMNFQINNRIHKTIHFIPDTDIDIENQGLVGFKGTFWVVNTDRFLESLQQFKKHSRYLFQSPHIKKPQEKKYMGEVSQGFSSFFAHTNFNLYDVIKDKKNAWTVRYPSGKIEKK